ncbi:MAG TPA: GAF and ANTAR domain-containing protein [Mycobacteriales bacterium]|jgi:hypothetical protein|nr:GAF and ANTAR domain-containing protein [Mycobacteriales bacterium]
MPAFRELAEVFARLGTAIGSARDPDDALTMITAAAVEAIDNAEAAAVTTGRTGSFKTVAATNDLPPRVDKIQYELRSGPCVDAVLERSTFHCDDLRTDPRWPEFGRRAAAETGVLSMLSFRMFFEEGDLIAALNVYATKPHAFDDGAETTGLVLATHGALALAGAMRLERVVNLERALATNRDIGVAMGILMNRHLATQQQAFDLLRVASQRTQRKLGDIAREVVETGQLDYPGPHPEPG